jgi:hypothetical protein
MNILISVIVVILASIIGAYVIFKIDNPQKTTVATIGHHAGKDSYEIIIEADGGNLTVSHCWLTTKDDGLQFERGNFCFRLSRQEASNLLDVLEEFLES